MNICISRCLISYERLYHNIRMISTQTSFLQPPKAVSKMTSWKPELFNKKIEVPYLIVEECMINKMKKQFKEYFLKIPNFKAVQEIETLQNENGNTVDENIKLKRIILNPDKIKTFEDFAFSDKQILKNEYHLSPEKHFSKVEIELNHTNYRPSTMLKGE